MKITDSMTLDLKALVYDTHHLSAAAFGAYLRLLMHAWMNCGRIPDDEIELRLICNTENDNFGVIWNQVEGFFIKLDNGYTQKRLINDLMKLANQLKEQENHAKFDINSDNSQINSDNSQNSRITAQNSTEFMSLKDKENHAELRINGSNCISNELIYNNIYNIYNILYRGNYIYKHGAKNNSQNSHEPRPKRRRGRKPTAMHELPVDFTPDFDYVAFGAEHGLSESAVHEQLESFKDWAKSNGRRKKDWSGTFRNWLRNCRERQRQWGGWSGAYVSTKERILREGADADSDSLGG